MKAIGLLRHGGPEVLEVVERPTPHAGPGEVRIRVRAATVNPADTLIRAGVTPIRQHGTEPVVSGLGVAGIIDEIGAGTSPRPTIGDRVMAMVNPTRPAGGGYAEWVVLPESWVVPTPVGAVGGYAVQLATAAGQRVLADCPRAQIISSTTSRTGRQSSDMRAVVLEKFGAPLVLTEIEKPVPGPGQVLVRVGVSGVNPLDTKIRAGKATHARTQPPAVLGLDLAGVVEEVGPEVTGFDPGDEVYGLTGGVGDLQGSLAEYAAVDARLLAHKPESLSLREAAALPLAVITAWEGLVDRARVRSGQQVLVHGGAGGVGQVAIQLARARGAEVFATGSTRSLETIARLGAKPIDYTNTSAEDYVTEYTGGEGFDVILDTIGGANLDLSFTAVRTYTGHVVSILGWGTHSLAPLSFRGATYSGVFTLLAMLTGRGREHHGEILRAAAALADEGALRPLVDPRRFTLATVADAHAAVESGTTTGKIVIDVE